MAVPAALVAVPAGLIVAEVLGFAAAGVALGALANFFAGRRITRINLEGMKALTTFQMRLIKNFPNMARRILKPQAINYELCMAMCSRIVDDERRLLCEFACAVLGDDTGQP